MSGSGRILVALMLTLPAGCGNSEGTPRFSASLRLSALPKAPTSAVADDGLLRSKLSFAPGAVRLSIGEERGGRLRGALNLLVVPVDFPDPLNEGPSPERLPPKPAGPARPLHNRAHFERLFFGPGEESLASYIRRQSGGLVELGGTILDWQTLPRPASYYGEDVPLYDAAGDVLRDEKGDRVLAKKDRRPVELVRDAFANLSGPLAEANFDRFDRHDLDRDQDLLEPDGMVDFPIILFAGEGQSAYGRIRPDLLWEHAGDAAAAAPYHPLRSAAQPAIVLPAGTQVREYMLVSQEVDLFTLVHEFAHLLGLPDLYGSDPAQQSLGYWTPLNGLRFSPGLYRVPVSLGAWEKVQLGWINPPRITLPPRGGAEAQEMVLRNANLPEAGIGAAAIEVRYPVQLETQAIFQPLAGHCSYWTGMQNNLEAYLLRTLRVPAPPQAARLRFKLWHDLEPERDGFGWKPSAPVSGRSCSGRAAVRAATGSTSPSIFPRWRAGWSASSSGCTRTRACAAEGRCSTTLSWKERGFPGAPRRGRGGSGRGTILFLRKGGW